MGLFDFKKVSIDPMFDGYFKGSGYSIDLREYQGNKCIYIVENTGRRSAVISKMEPAEGYKFIFPETISEINNLISKQLPFILIEREGEA